MTEQGTLLQVEPSVHCLGSMTDIEQVKPNPDNPNVHPQDQVEMLARILEAAGWREAIVVSRRSGLVVKGHGRLQAARFLKLARVPVETQDYADEQAELSDMIADNRIAQHAYTDALKLGGLLKRVSTKRTESLGYSQEEINLLLAAEYVPPTATDRQFQVLETLKMTKEAKAIVAHAVTRFCIRSGKEVEWGEALATICMEWETMQPPAPIPASQPVEPKPVLKPVEPKPVLKPASEIRPMLILSNDPDKKVKFYVRYVAETEVCGKKSFVIRTSTQTRYYTDDAAIADACRGVDDREVTGVVRMQNNVPMILSAEVA